MVAGTVGWQGAISSHRWQNAMYEYVEFFLMSTFYECISAPMCLFELHPPPPPQSRHPTWHFPLFATTIREAARPNGFQESRPGDGHLPWEASEPAASLAMSATANRGTCQGVGGEEILKKSLLSIQRLFVSRRITHSPHGIFHYLLQPPGKLPAPMPTRRISQAIAISPSRHRSQQLPW